MVVYNIVLSFRTDQWPDTESLLNNKERVLECESFRKKKIPAFAGMTEEESGMTEEDFTPTLILPPQGGKQY